MALFSRCRNIFFAERLPGHHIAQPALDPETPIEEVPYVVLDTELTGLDPRQDSIVSIAALRIRGGSILIGEHFSRIVQPRTPLNGKSIVIHGITPSDTLAAPSFPNILPAFLDFITGSVLVGHALSIDLAFLKQEMGQLSLQQPLRPALDTMAIEAFLKKRTRDCCAFHDVDHGRLDLDSLAREKGVPIYQTHDAISDAYVTAQLFQRYLAELPKHQVRTIGALIAIGKP